AFLFVRQGDACVGSGRGLPGFDLFAWIEEHQDWIVKYGGHQGAVGLTVRAADFETFRKRLMATAREAQAALDPALVVVHHADVSSQVEAVVRLEELDEFWW